MIVIIIINILIITSLLSCIRILEFHNPIRVPLSGEGRNMGLQRAGRAGVLLRAPGGGGRRGSVSWRGNRRQPRGAVGRVPGRLARGEQEASL